VKNSKKKFIKIPEYSGGKEAFGKYIDKNLVYPKEAQENRVEGIVYLIAEINDNGKVLNVSVERGIGHGCDEEAIRLVNNVSYTRVRNRGKRVKTKKKIRIAFKLPMQNKVQFNLVKTSSVKNTEVINNYSYTINIKSR